MNTIASNPGANRAIGSVSEHLQTERDASRTAGEAASMQRQRNIALRSSVIGTALEWYDFFSMVLLRRSYSTCCFYQARSDDGHLGRLRFLCPGFCGASARRLCVWPYR